MSDEGAPSPHHPRALSAERRSPRATSFDPPVLKAEWSVAGDTPLAAFLEDARARVSDDEAFERLLRHGGMHLDRRRLCDFPQPPETIPAGTSVVAYWFTKEPDVLVLPGDLVLFDAHGLVAVNKPPWWTTQGTRASRFASLERALRDALSCPALVPINRIDRETTGVLLFARDSRAASSAGKQLIARSVRKEYIAVVEDVPETPQAWDVRGRMVRIAHPSHSLFALREGDEEGEEGDWSATRFELLSRGANGLAMVRALPLTGRTHQIRVHLLARGLPIAGDSLYGAGWQPGNPLSAERMLLHSAAITLRVDSRETTISAPVPPDFPASPLPEAP